jgi:hypothetical protein
VVRRFSCTVASTASMCVLREQAVTAAEREQAKIRKAEMIADPEWVKRFLGGDVKARHDMVALTYLISAEVAG